jgi:hypothetical protein
MSTHKHFILHKQADILAVQARAKSAPPSLTKKRKRGESSSTKARKK